MDIFVDTNILLDAKIGDVYKFFLTNKDNIYIEHTMLKHELQRPIGYAKELLNCGLNLTDMTDEEFILSQNIYNKNNQLSFYDCVAYSICKVRKWKLVTGDKKLRKISQKSKIEVHGFIWILQRCNISDSQMTLILQLLMQDNTRRIPKDKLIKAFPTIKENFKL